MKVLIHTIRTSASAYLMVLTTFGADKRALASVTHRLNDPRLFLRGIGANFVAQFGIDSAGKALECGPVTCSPPCDSVQQLVHYYLISDGCRHILRNGDGASDNLTSKASALVVVSIRSRHTSTDSIGDSGGGRHLQPNG
jgi:hypothetical protein